jgi:hypothetical protein
MGGTISFLSSNSSGRNGSSKKVRCGDTLRTVYRAIRIRLIKQTLPRTFIKIKKGTFLANKRRRCVFEKVVRMLLVEEAINGSGV